MPFSILVADESKFKRLFTTLKQRLEIDRLKDARGYSEVGKDNSSNIKVTSNKSQKVENRVKVTGLVRKDNGLTLVWIKHNGQLKLTATRNSKSQPVIITGEPVVIINVDKNTQNLSIKPGQTWLRDKNKVYDDWQLTSMQTTEALKPKSKNEPETEANTETKAKPEAKPESKPKSHSH